MPTPSQTGPAPTWERVHVHGHPADHLAPHNGMLTLCGRTAQYPVKYRAPKPTCRRCQLEARRLATTPAT